MEDACVPRGVFLICIGKNKKKTGKEIMLQPAFYRKRLHKYKNYTIGKS